MRAVDIQQRFDRLRAEKQAGRDLINQVNEFFQPTDEIYQGTQHVGSSQTEKGELLDTTVSDMLNEFVSSVLGIYYSTEVAWFRLELPEVELDQTDQRILSNRARLLYRLISRSNYYAVCPVHEWDAIVHGHAMMIIEKDEDEFARCYTKQPAEIYFQQSEDHKVIETYWESELSTASLVHKYPEATKKVNIANESDVITRHYVIHSITPNTDFYRQGVDPEHVVNLPKNKNKSIYRSILYSSSAQGLVKTPRDSLDMHPPMLVDKDRFIPCRNRPSREHAYGDGFGKKALVRARILNKLMRDTIRSSGRSANPPRVVDPQIKAQLKNPDELGEGEILSPPNRLGERLQDTVLTLDVRSEIPSILEAIRHQEEKISTQLPTTSSAYKVSRQSVQEIQQRLREQEKRLGPLRSFYLKEGVSRHLRRFYNIAKEQGYFKRDEYRFQDESLERKTPKFNFDSLLLSSHRLTQALLINQSLAQSQALFTIQPTTTHRIDGEKAIKYIWEGNSVPQILKSDEEVEAQREAILQQQQQTEQVALQQQQAQSLTAGAESLKTLSEIVPNA